MAEKESNQSLRAVVGVLFLVVLVGIAYVTVQLFEQNFTSTTAINLETPRAGLLMAVGADVKERGVTIGEVKDVHLNPDGTVRLKLGIYPDQLRYVASNVSANIIPPTVFGAKYVELVPPSVSAGSIAAGATIDVSHVNVEINTTFEHLVGLLDAAQPAKVSAALNAFATALKDNGNRAAQLIQLTDRYLSGLNPALNPGGRLNFDLVKGAQVSKNLTKDVLPGLIKVGANGGLVSDTLVNSQATLAAVLTNITTFGDKTTTFINQIRPTLKTALDYMQPTTQLLAEYAPELPCTIEGLNDLRRMIEPIAGGNSTGQIKVYADLLPGDAPYTYPKNNPVIGAKNPPSCYDLPLIPSGKVLTTLPYNVGANPNVGKVPNGGTAGTPGGSSAALATTLFGTLAGLVQQGLLSTGGTP